jgi:hypothetical protein
MEGFFLLVVWALAPEDITEHMENTMESNAKLWIFSMISSLRQDELTRCLVTLWSIWFARWKAIDEGIFQSPLTTNCFVENFIRELGVVSDKKKYPRPSAPSAEPRWIAPVEEYMKINVDAAQLLCGNI